MRTSRSRSPSRSARNALLHHPTIPPSHHLKENRGQYGEKNSQVHAHGVPRRLPVCDWSARAFQGLPSVRGRGVRRWSALVRGGRRRPLPVMLLLLPGRRFRRDGRFPQGRSRSRPPDALARRQRRRPRIPAQRHDTPSCADVQEARHELHPQLRRAQRCEQPEVVRAVHPRGRAQSRSRRDDDGPAARHRQPGHPHAGILPRPPAHDYGRRHPVRPRRVQGRFRHFDAHYRLLDDEARSRTPRQGRAHTVPFARDGGQRRGVLSGGAARRRGRHRPLHGSHERRHLPA